MKEFELIATWFKDSSQNRSDVYLGVGDDAALIGLDKDHELVTASACETSQTCTTPEQMANKCYHNALESLLKQHATPAWGMLCLCLGDVEPDWIQRFANDLYNCMRVDDVQLIGGDTTAGPTQATLFLSGHRLRSET